MNQANDQREYLNLGLDNPDLSQQIQDRFNREHNHDGINSAKLSLPSSSNIASGTTLPIASEYALTFFFKTDTDTLYFSNGTSWLAIN